MTFKIGDRVKVTNPLPEKAKDLRGMSGTVSAFGHNRFKAPQVEVCLDFEQMKVAFHALELSPLREAKPKKTSARKKGGPNVTQAVD